MSGTPSVKIIETPSQNEAHGTLQALLMFGIGMPLLGGLLIAFGPDAGGHAARWAGFIMAGVGGVLLQVAVIGYGVMLGVRGAAR